jgi:TonB-linked SusC/RagA family outer membrane protein
MKLPRIRLPGVATALLVVAGFAAGPLEAQQGTVAGQVTDKSNQQPVAGAQVLVVGTSLQARTSREGRYTIAKVPVGRYSVQVRLIGYATGTQPVTVTGDQTASADFALAANPVPLDAVVVSATGQEQLKRELGNNVPTIDAAKVAQEAAPNNTADLLNSRVPGVVVEQSGGTAGTGSRIRIRGSTSLSLRNEPVIVVDGVRIDNTANADGGIGVGGQAPSRLNDLNPEDIESIEVVKGPSAAVLYGTDAANGVIQIHTKQGRPGPTKWTAFAEGGVANDVTNWPANYAALDATGASCLVPLMALPASDPLHCTITQVKSFNPLEVNPPFRQDVRQHYGLSAAGGNEITTYYLSGDFQREKGIFESNDLTKTNLRANLRSQVSRLMDINGSVGYVSSNVSLPQNDNNDQGLLASGLLGNTDTTNGGYAFLTPAQANKISTTQRIERFTGGLTANFRPWSFLTMRGTGGYDVTNQGDNELTPPNQIPLDQSRLDGNAFQYRAQTFSYTANVAATASFRLSPRVTSNTTLGLQYYKNVFQQVRASGRKVVAGCAALSCVVIPTVGDTTAPFVTLGEYVEEAVGINERLFLTAAVRGDRNSAFGQDFGNIKYPKVSGSWVLSEEPFFPRLGWLQTLRLRAAWGQSGRAPGPLDALQYYNPVAVAVNKADVAAITIGGVGNPALKPERTREIETGFDADLVNQRVHLEFTYYDKSTTDALVARTLAPSLGVSNDIVNQRFENLGKISNRGVEIAVTAQLLSGPDVNWTVSASAWGNRNRVLDLGKGISPIIFGLGGATQRFQAGYPAGGYWGQSYTYSDANHDGLISAKEVTIVSDTDQFQGSLQPTHGGTLSTEVGFLKHFRLYGLLDGRFGNKLDNSTESFRCLFAICAGLNNTNAPLADQAAAVATAFYGLETGFFQDAGFVKLREVSLTYVAPPLWASRIGARDLSFTISGRNLVTWTSYKGVDPEVNTTGQLNFSTAEFLTQPPVRYFIGRVNVTF